MKFLHARKFIYIYKYTYIYILWRKLLIMSTVLPELVQLLFFFCSSSFLRPNLKGVSCCCFEHTHSEREAVHTCLTNLWDKSDATMNFCVRLASIYCVLFISSIMLRAFHNKTDEMTSERRKCCWWWWWWWWQWWCNAYVLCTNCITCATSWWAIYWHLIEMYVLARKKKRVSRFRWKMHKTTNSLTS